MLCTQQGFNKYCLKNKIKEYVEKRWINMCLYQHSTERTFEIESELKNQQCLWKITWLSHSSYSFGVFIAEVISQTLHLLLSSEFLLILYTQKMWHLCEALLFHSLGQDFIPISIMMSHCTVIFSSSISQALSEY